MIVEVEIVGLITIHDAKSKADAIELVKQMFEDEKLTWNDLGFYAEDDDAESDE